MDKIVEVFLHGALGKAVGKDHWKVNVKSPAEALYAINIMTKDSMRRYFLKSSNMYLRYKVLVNDIEIPFVYNESFLQNNDLLIKSEDFKRLDVIPVLEGAKKWFKWLAIILGVVALGVGLFAGLAIEIAMPLALAGLGLLAAGVSSLLAKPPKMPEQRQISNPSSDPSLLDDSYLFGGPVNVLNEGGPIPLGYGRLIVGSQVIMSSYDFQYIDVRDAGRRR